MFRTWILQWQQRRVHETVNKKLYTNWKHTQTENIHKHTQTENPKNPKLK